MKMYQCINRNRRASGTHSYKQNQKNTELHKMGMLLIIPKLVRHISSIMKLKEKWINLAEKIGRTENRY